MVVALTDLYDNLLKATDNTNDITTEKFGTITKINGSFCSVIEEDNNLEHHNVQILNLIPCKTGDKVVVGFVENSIYNPIVLGNLSRKIESSGASIEEVEQIVNSAIEELDVNLDMETMSNGYLKIKAEIERGSG